MESSPIRDDEDISATMMRRARCHRVARYNMDTTSNIKRLSEDAASSRPSSEMLMSTFALLRLWTWIDRVESLCDNVEEIENGISWTTKSLFDAGVWSLLGFDIESLPNSDMEVFSETLQCSIFESEKRR